MKLSDPAIQLSAAARSAPAPSAELPQVAFGFLEQLRRLPLGAWADAARRMDAHVLVPPPPGTPASASSVARARLRHIVDDMPGVVGQTRRRVHDLAAVAQGFVHPAEVARMKKAALTAALAIVARPSLGEDDFERLYAPFAEHILLGEPAEQPGQAPSPTANRR